MSPRLSGNTALGTALPCAACKQPVIETRSVDGALVVLDAGTKRLHLCLKRKEVEAAKAKQVVATRSGRPRPSRPLPPAKRAEVPKPPERTRPARPVRVKVPEPPRKAPPRRKPRKATLRSPQQVEEILKGSIVRWRTGTDSPTSFCAEYAAPVLVGFSHVRWDVMVLDAAGHRPHDCRTSRMAADALLRDRLAPSIDIPVVAEPAAPARRVVRRAPVIAPVTPSVTVAPRPRRRPTGSTSREGAANSCETCGKLTAVMNGERLCLHCGA
ncbi:MAG: hypothetical protein JWM95_3613 [Gemmatimonadetes bacterium]|nr:hypothetical protein [Gemmatimonadota bacterium]